MTPCIGLARRTAGLLIELLARFTLEFVGVALGLHLLVIHQTAQALLDVTFRLFTHAFRGTNRFGGILASFTLKLLCTTFGLHLLIASQIANPLLDVAADLV